MGRLSVVLVSASALALAGCESMSPATYANFADNVVALRNYGNAKVAVVSMNDQSKLDAGCRLVGPITASGNRTIPQFIQDSFNEELKFANIHSLDQGAAQLRMTLVTAEFSSMSGLTNGWWDLAVNIENPAYGRSMTTSSRY